MGSWSLLWGHGSSYGVMVTSMKVISRSLPWGSWTQLWGGGVTFPVMGSSSLLSAHLTITPAYLFTVYSQSPHLLNEYFNCFIVVQFETICTFVKTQHMQMIYDCNCHCNVFPSDTVVTVNTYLGDPH